MKDLSALAKNSLTVTSQAAGNMVSSNEQAMTAPGGRPVDPLPDRADQGDPALDTRKAHPVGDTGRGRPGTSYAPAAPAWKTTGGGQ